MSASLHEGEDNPFRSDWDDGTETKQQTEEEGIQQHIATAVVSGQEEEHHKQQDEAQSQQQQTEGMANPEIQNQQSQNQQPRRPTRLALRDNLNWKDEIKVRAERAEVADIQS